MSNSLAKRQIKNAVKKTAKKGKKKATTKATAKKKTLVSNKRKRKETKNKEKLKLLKNTHTYKMKFEKGTGSAKSLSKEYKVKKNVYSISQKEMVKNLNKIGYSVKVKGKELTVLNIWSKPNPGRY